jgi:cytosine permease
MVLPVAIVQPIASMIAGLYMNSIEIGYVLTIAGGVLGLILVVLGTWTSNDNGLYSASLAVTEIFPKWKRWKVTVITGILASLLAAVVDLGMYENLMYFFSSIAVPVLGVTLADFYILPKIGLKRGLAKEKGIKLNSSAVVSWIIGAFLESTMDFGIIPNHLGIPTVIISTIVTALIYIVSMKVRFSNDKATAN